MFSLFKSSSENELKRWFFLAYNDDGDYDDTEEHEDDNEDLWKTDPDDDDTDGDDWNDYEEQHPLNWRLPVTDPTTPDSNNGI